MQCLLDKSVVRNCLKGLLRGATTEDVRQSLRLFATYSPNELYISLQTLHILTYIVKVPQARVIIARTSLLYPVRYTKRWARRLRETGFSREDAFLLSLATFGTNQLQSGSIMGVQGLVTCDVRLQRHYQEVQSHLAIRLRRMTAQLAPPYHKATLPIVLTPEQSLGFRE